MRMRGSELFGLDGDEHVEDDSTIYYLHTATPHLHDISIPGPHDSNNAIAWQMKHNFGSTCRLGQNMVGEYLEHHTLLHMEHITSPIDNDQNRTKTCRIIRETNAEVKARLLGAVFVVISSEVDMELACSGVASAVPDGVPTKSADVHGTFTDRSSAVEHARELAQEMAGPNGRFVERAPQSMYELAFVVQGDDGSTSAVVVRQDAGQSV